MRKIKKVVLILAAVAVAAGAGAGLGVAYLALPAGAFDSATTVDSATGRASQNAAELETTTSQLERAALAYVQAVQDRDAAGVIGMTLWMQERLSYAQVTAKDASDVVAARAALERKILKRVIEHNQLCSEGVEDKYVFAPGAEVEVAGVDEGRSDLAEPAAGRVWLRVTYPRESVALRGNNGDPIHSLRVGVNLTRGQKVLKASVIGNLDIDYESLSFEWD